MLLLIARLLQEKVDSINLLVQQVLLSLSLLFPLAKTLNPLSPTALVTSRLA